MLCMKEAGKATMDHWLVVTTSISTYWPLKCVCVCVTQKAKISSCRLAVTQHSSEALGCLGTTQVLRARVTALQVGLYHPQGDGVGA